MKKGIIKIIITVTLVSALLYKIGIAEIINNLYQVKFIFLGSALGLTPLLIFIKSYKWYFLIQKTGHKKVTFVQAARSFLVGLSFAVITPLRSGEAARIFYLKGEDKASLAGCFMVDKIIDFLSVAIFSLIGIIILLKANYTGMIVLGFIALTLVFLFKPKIFANLLSRLPIIGQWADRFTKPLVSLTPQVTIRTLGLGLVFFAIFYFQAYLMVLAFGTISPQGVLFFPLITLSTILPLTIGGIGVREGMAVVLLSSYGVSKEVAINAFFMHFVVILLLPGIVGPFFVTKGKGLQANSQGEQ